MILCVKAFERLYDLILGLGCVLVAVVNEHILAAVGNIYIINLGFAVAAAHNIFTVSLCALVDFTLEIGEAVKFKGIN